MIDSAHNLPSAMYARAKCEPDRVRAKARRKKRRKIARNSRRIKRN